jgi:uncharacterized Zn finger protein (UPF0148 family)
MVDQAKEMAVLLMRGGTMLSANCPSCGSPLFKVKGEVLCPQCSKGAAPKREGVGHALDSVVAAKVNELAARLEAATDPLEVAALLKGIDAGLDILARTKEPGP